jgi:predicted nucleic acid-binding protein
LIVIDASALLELLTSTARAGLIRSVLAAPNQTIHAPHLIDLEVVQVLRRLVARGLITEARGEIALLDLRDFPIQRYAHSFLLERVWELRHNVTAYDASYLALAETLDCPLLTRDQRLANAAGHSAQTIVV